MDVDLSSIPGWCVLKDLGTTNREVFKVDEEGRYNLDRVKMVIEIVKKRWMEIKESDPIYAFVKPEPHKREKLNSGRLRLISGISLIDSLIDRLLFMKWTLKTRQMLTKTPIAVGWTPLDAVKFHHMMGGMHEQYLDVDKSAWDWSLKPWILDMVKRVLCGLVVAPTWWHQRVNKRFELLFGNPIWKFQDSSMIQQKQPGIMKSGCYMTIWINSIGQLILHQLAQSRCGVQMHVPMVVGDDTTQPYYGEDVDAYLQETRNLGFVIKPSIGRIAEFCGFRFDGFKSLPAYRSKHQFLLRHLTLDDEIATQTIQSYQLLYYNDKYALQQIRTLAIQRGLLKAVVPDHVLWLIIDGLQT
ncbi:hypothetical protein 2 [Sanxia sobemo-like virus 2]|uniref:hypothetical protein 2 n=1 Tax=Sanxia sobemo-like virus 2 TaxID=1923381 RepID=UPI00090C59E9|nr:hypothetical protein 2 [Sanxia sobemo-like virus 2]APG75869.1 hypothetical protein 2 [Sanxia sobemo-like virus 2]